MTAPSSSSHRFIDHTSEVELELRAPSFGELVAEAGRGLASLLLRDVPMAPQGEARRLEVSSHDREALLVDWLNEILFVAETELWVPVEFEIMEVSGAHIRARARGVAVEVAPSIVKAATFHGLHVRETADGFEAEVILDV